MTQATTSATGEIACEELKNGWRGVILGVGDWGLYVYDAGVVCC